MKQSLTKFLWLNITPFGTPVVPLVNKIAAVSSCETSGKGIAFFADFKL